MNKPKMAQLLAMSFYGEDVNPALKRGLQSHHYNGVTFFGEDKTLTQKHENYHPIIAVQMQGGLGNQLFQAAAGLALSQKIGAQLILDLSKYRMSSNRSFELAPLAINCELRGDATSLRRFLNRKLRKILKQKPIPEWWSGFVYEQPSFTYDHAFEEIRESAYLVGYFQSARFFKGAELAIAEAFNPIKLASSYAIQQAELLKGGETAALHIRRGDYANNPQVKNSFGIMEFDYYDKAVALLRQNVPNARIFIFSDDQAVALEASARWPNVQVMQGKSAGDDLFLMSSARHHILANSSFSWWSAWLDQRVGGMRIAPQQWFLPAMLETHPIHDLIPPDWIQI